MLDSGPDLKFLWRKEDQVDLRGPVRLPGSGKSPFAAVDYECAVSPLAL